MRNSVNHVVLAAFFALCACTPPHEASSASNAPAKPSYITITVRSDGIVEINGDVVEQSNLEQRFAELAATGAYVVISPHKDANYAEFARVMEAAQRTGLMKKMGVIGGT